MQNLIQREESTAKSVESDKEVYNDIDTQLNPTEAECMKLAEEATADS